MIRTHTLALEEKGRRGSEGWHCGDGLAGRALRRHTQQVSTRQDGRTPYERFAGPAVPVGIYARAKVSGGGDAAALGVEGHVAGKSMYDPRPLGGQEVGRRRLSGLGPCVTFRSPQPSKIWDRTIGHPRAPQCVPRYTAGWTCLDLKPCQNPESIAPLQYPNPSRPIPRAGVHHQSHDRKT